MKAIFRAEEPEHYAALTEMTAIWSKADQAASERRIKEFEANWAPSRPGKKAEADEEAPEAAPAEPAKKRGRPKKVVETIEETFDEDLAVEQPVEPEPVAAEPVAAEPEEEFEPPKFLRPEPAPEPEPVKQPEALEPEEVTIDTVRSAFLELSARRSPEAVIELLAKYGSRKASDVPEDKRFAIVRDARALIDG